MADYAFILWDDICDIIWDSDKWPTKIRKIFQTKNETHFNRFILCAFVYISGLNPEVFLEWADVVGLCRDVTGLKSLKQTTKMEKYLPVQHFQPPV